MTYLVEVFHAIPLHVTGNSTNPSKTNFEVDKKNILGDSTEETAIVF